MTSTKGSSRGRSQPGQQYDPLNQVAGDRTGRSDGDRAQAFVGVMPAAWDRLIDQHGLSRDAEYLLFKLVLVADWRIAETTLAVRDLVAWTRMRFQRLRRALDELMAAGIVEAHHRPGHGGFVRILAYPEIVYRPAQREAALREHLAEAQLRTARQRAGPRTGSGDEEVQQIGAAIAHGATPSSDSTAIAHGATAQSRTARRTVADGATTTSACPSALRRGSDTRDSRVTVGPDLLHTLTLRAVRRAELAERPPVEREMDEALQRLRHAFGDVEMVSPGVMRQAGAA